MRATTAGRLVVSVTCLCLGPRGAFAQDNEPLPHWKPNAEIVAQLGEVYEDAQIHIRAPRGLKKADRPHPPELARRGVYSYGWTPEGVIHSHKHLSVTFTPFDKPSSHALDETVEGMKESLRRNFGQVQFGEVQRGRIGGVAARSGTYSASLSGERIIGYYIVGIDNIGSFSIGGMLPRSKATPDEVAQLKAAMLTFRRPGATRSAAPIKDR